MDGDSAKVITQEKHLLRKCCLSVVGGLLFNLGLSPIHAASLAHEKLSLLLPVSPSCISSGFGPRVLANRPQAGTFHYGIDLPAPIGAPVAAVAPGNVIRVQRRGIGGLEVLIQHNGFVSIYSHLGLVSPKIAEGGRSVYGGERIGTVGRSGLTFGPHLYFGMLVDGNPVDPKRFLNVDACGVPTQGNKDTRLRPTRLFAQP